MNKKRGVLISTPNHPPRTVNKSHSAHSHPLPRPELPHPHPHASHPHPPHPVTQSNLLSEEPERLVNQAYYTYQDPDSLPHHHQYSDRSEDENEEQAIVSMQKRQEELIRQQREEQKARIAERAKSSACRITKNKQASVNKSKPPIAGGETVKQTVRTRPKEIALNQQKQPKVQAEMRKEKREINPAILKPKPLVFSVNMFSKSTLSPRSRLSHEQAISKLSERIQQKTLRGREQPLLEQVGGENLNCKKLPFRFSGLI